MYTRFGQACFHEGKDRDKTNHERDGVYSYGLHRAVPIDERWEDERKYSAAHVGSCVVLDYVYGDERKVVYAPMNTIPFASPRRFTNHSDI